MSDAAPEPHAAADLQLLVDWAMRYGNPSIAARLDAMKAQGCDRILIAPLYPQYSGATTATANDAAFAALGVRVETLDRAALAARSGL